MVSTLQDDALRQKIDSFSKRSNDELLESKGSKVLGRIMLILLLFFIIILFLPWRQTIPGRGTVTALRPEDRPQNVQNQIGGRIERWLVREGESVKKGDTILLISETSQSYFDPLLPTRLDEQLNATISNENATQQKIRATGSQILALRNGLRYQLSSAENEVKQAANTVQIDAGELQASQKFYAISKYRLVRYETGYKNGLFSLTDIESRRLKLQEDSAIFVSKQNTLNSAKQALLNASIELDNIRAKYQESIAKADADMGSALSSRAGARSDISKLKNEIANVGVRRGLYVVRAPQDGFVVKTLKAGVGENIKEGESIATLQPKSPLVAVELYVDAMNVPLVSDGNPTRLQFEGWPSVQFSGWPSVAVGTFAGEISVVDRVSSENRQYRLLIRQPNRLPKNDEPWPTLLRQGSGVYGRVILRSVPVWYEIWRQLNGFPPNLEKAPEKQ